MAFNKNMLVVALATLSVCTVADAHASGHDQGAGRQSAGASPAGARHAAAASAADPASASSAKRKGKTQRQLLHDTLSTITVVGYNRSVETSIAYQRFSGSIVNVVTAADMTGLPDQSIADALTRLPGVAAQRIGGQASQINIRGLSGNFIQTTLDGRVQPSTSGSNYIQFDIYPAELVNRVTVYKSSQADLIEGGVGGTIAMRTANPLHNAKSQIFNLDVRSSYDSRANQIFGDSPWSYRLSAAYQGKFFHNTLGVGIGFAQLTQPHVAEQYLNESYATSTQMLGGRPTYVNSGMQINQDGGSEIRRGYLGTLVWEPSRHLRVDATGFYSNFNDGSFQRGLRAQVFTGGDALITNPTISPDGALLGATVSSLPGGFYGIPGLQEFSVQTTDNNQSNQASIFSGGLNIRWRNGPWTVIADLSQSRAQSYQVGSDVTADAFTGLGTSQPRIANESMSFALNGLNVGQFSLTDPSLYTNLSDMALSQYALYPTSYHDDMKALRLTVDYALRRNPIFDELEGGIYLNDHKYQSARAAWIYGSYYGDYWLLTANQPPLTLNSSDAATTCWSGSRFGSFPCFLAINGAAVLSAHGITAHPVKQWAQDWTEQQSGTVNENIRDAFFQADIDTTVFHHELTGNIGLRISHTSQYSPGLQQVGNGQGVPIADGLGVVSRDFIRVDPGQTYTNYLPSVNLNYHLTYHDQIRFAAAKVMARPPIDLLKSGSASYITNGQYNLYSGTNPMLDPMYAEQYDLAFEHYFRHASGVISADLFYKHIDSFVQTVTDYNFNFAAAGYTVPIDPQTSKPYLDGEFQTAYNNTQGGYVTGVELQFQKTHFLPGIWSGLGIGLNYAYTESGTRVTSDLGGFPQKQSLPGLSKNVASAAIFYDHGPFSTRLAANYRSAFVSASQVSFNFQTVYFAAETVVDYQAAYRFTHQLSGLFQVLNLTDQPTRTYFGNPQETSTLQYFGRTLYAGFSLTL